MRTESRTSKLSENEMVRWFFAAGITMPFFLSGGMLAINWFMVLSDTDWGTFFWIVCLVLAFLVPPRLLAARGRFRTLVVLGLCGFALTYPILALVIDTTDRSAEAIVDHILSLMQTNVVPN